MYARLIRLLCGQTRSGLFNVSGFWKRSRSTEAINLLFVNTTSFLKISSPCRLYSLGEFPTNHGWPIDRQLPSAGMPISSLEPQTVNLHCVVFSVVQFLFSVHLVFC